MRRICAVALVCVGVVWAAACGSSSTPTTPTTTSRTSSVQVVAGTLSPGDTPSSTFQLPAGAPLHIMFASLTDSSNRPLGSTVTLTYGVMAADGVTCLALTRVPATAALKAQINVLASAGQYCVGLEDTASVPGPANYDIRVTYGTPSDETSSGTITYASSVVPGGSTSRTFGAAADGVATITMDSFSPASVAALGLAIGIQRNDGTGCEITAAALATPGAQVSIPVDAGLYCIKVFDPGTLTDLTTFSLRILHP